MSILEFVYIISGKYSIWSQYYQNIWNILNIWNMLKVCKGLQGNLIFSTEGLVKAK